MVFVGRTALQGSHTDVGHVAQHCGFFAQEFDHFHGLELVMQDLEFKRDFEKAFGADKPSSDKPLFEQVFSTGSVSAP